MFKSAIILSFLLVCKVWGNMEAYLIDQNAKPQPALLELLQLLHVPHDGTLDSIVRATQTAWYQAGKERWELEERYPGKLDLAFPILRKLGCVDSIFAKKKKYDYALLLGGHVSRMKRRIALLVQEWKRGVRFDKIVLLTGARPLDPSEELSCATETEAFLALLDLPAEMKKVPLQVIDTPMQTAKGGGQRRPNTADTLMAWLLSKPKPGSCIAFGDQPFVGYFESVLKTFLPSAFSVEVIGLETEPYPLALFFDNLARWLYQEQLRFQALSR